MKDNGEEMIYANRYNQSIVFRYTHPQREILV